MATRPPSMTVSIRRSIAVGSSAVHSRTALSDEILVRIWTRPGSSRHARPHLFLECPCAKGRDMKSAKAFFCLAELFQDHAKPSFTLPGWRKVVWPGNLNELF